MSERNVRSTADVIDDHIACRLANDIDGDLARNYSDQVVILTAMERVTERMAFAICTIDCAAPFHRTIRS